VASFTQDPEESASTLKRTGASVEELATVPNVTAMTEYQADAKTKHTPEGGMSFSR
jgi:hypothetical protein